MLKQKILIVDDDENIAELISLYLAKEQYDTEMAHDGEEALQIIDVYNPDLILLDIMLPGIDGYEVCREIRKISKVPIIFISSAADNMNIVMAVNMGADDFIAKPFDQSVLMAKIQAMLRRTYDFADGVTVLEHRGAFLNTGDNTLTYQDNKIGLTKNEYRILLCLMENKGKIVSREKLMERLWETDCFVDENTLTVNINRLRKKLDFHGLNHFIATKHGVGYIIE